MARYLTEADAAQAGITITHEPAAQRFAIYREGNGGAELVGEAHYSFPREGVVDFDHTVVDESLRGTGLSGLLAHRAVTSDIAQAHTVQASCWFIEGYLAKHPELLNQST
ncbi:hypothetical protein ACIFOC_00745 [Leucobacter aridicollis]|uniref:GNAT family N-acetyltransferase n=1 Tax=Leucobacter aridicollis TaxID=283878 RepID=UPI00216A069A|nr:GNAT family N-acetyltransferase [Leucobacter aridicollis]MCS3427048.1 putative GNAT family acetyltransferase [Leucobacter aridicollis]